MRHPRSSASSSGAPGRNIAQHYETPRDKARDRLLDRFASQLGRTHARFSVRAPVQVATELIGHFAVSGGEVFGHCRDKFLATERSVAGQGAGERQADFHGAFMLREERATPV
jgi:hypothetical protein